MNADTAKNIFGETVKVANEPAVTECADYWLGRLIAIIDLEANGGITQAKAIRTLRATMDAFHRNQLRPR